MRNIGGNTSAQKKHSYDNAKPTQVFEVKHDRPFMIGEPSRKILKQMFTDGTWREVELGRRYEIKERKYTGI